MNRKTKLKHLHFEKIDSTNTWAKRNAHLWELGSLTLITADEQTAGRGQFKKTWLSPPSGNIYATFCFVLPALPQDLGGLTLDLARAAQSTLGEFGVNARLKWPNDLLVNHKKIAGILGEVFEHPEGIAIALGIGINVGTPKAQLAQLDQAATSLFIETGQKLPPSKILQRLCHEVESLLTIKFF